MLLLGIGAAVTGSGYKFGSLARMGPGFMPVVLGIVLAFIGILIAGTALTSSEPDDSKFLPDNPQWFGWFCILMGPVLFIVLGYYGGMIPAVFACVFVCALGDKTVTLAVLAENGAPSPAPKITTRPFSRCLIARLGMYGSATCRIVIAVCTRVSMPRCSSASCKASALITVLSMPM